MSQIIENIKARELLDSRGTPCLEVQLSFKSGAKGFAMLPSGASTGSYEACELRDKDPSRFFGKGVLKAKNQVESLILKKLKNKKIKDQKEMDEILIDLDGTKNKSLLGANSILGVSMAFARAVSDEKKIPLIYSLNEDLKQLCLPTPLMNVLNGGAHANNKLDVQEFMIVPVCGGSFKEALRAGAEIYSCLKKILERQNLSTGLGDEGGFSPFLETNIEALDLLLWAIDESSYEAGKDVFLALDVASTELYDRNLYHFEGRQISGENLLQIYENWLKHYPIISIEDAFSEDDWPLWKKLNRSLGDKLQCVGDDLFVTDENRLKKGISENAANSILIKLNQIGSITETLSCMKLAEKSNYTRIISHRSGDTEDSFISDFCVAFGGEQIKTGGLARSERIAKYNQLLRIEEEAKSSVFLGKKAFKHL